MPKLRLLQTPAHLSRLFFVIFFPLHCWLRLAAVLLRMALSSVSFNVQWKWHVIYEARGCLNSKLVLFSQPWHTLLTPLPDIL